MQVELNYTSAQSTEGAAAAAVTRREWLFVIATALAVLAVTTLPYLYGYWSAPPEKQFMAVIYNIPGHMTYL